MRLGLPGPRHGTVAHGACAAARRAWSLAAAAAPRRCSAAGAAVSAPPAEQRAAPAAVRSVHVGNLPFDAAPDDVASALLAALRCGAGGASAARLVTRVVVSDYSACGVAEFDCTGGEAEAPLPPPWPGAHVERPRKARDVGKRNRGFALLCCASAGAAAAAAAALAVQRSSGEKDALTGRQLRVGGDGGSAAALYVREMVAAAAAAEAQRVAEREAKRAARAPHRQRQKARARAARDADLARLLRAAFSADVSSEDMIVDDDMESAVATPDAAVLAAEAAAVEALWGGAFSGWADAEASAAAGALPWSEAPDAADPCRGGGLDPSPGGRGERKRQQVESFVAALRGLGLARPGAVRARVMAISRPVCSC